MKYSTLEEARNSVAPYCNTNELLRIDEEIELFKQRNWEEYVLFLIDLTSKLKKTLSFLSKSAMDSYLIYKCIHQEENVKLLKKQRSKEILFNDALRLNIDIVSIMHALIKQVEKVNDIVESTLCEYSFYRDETLLNSSSELLILSKRRLTSQEINALVNEKKEDNYPLLKEVLLIKIHYEQGL